MKIKNLVMLSFKWLLIHIYKLYGFDAIVDCIVPLILIYNCLVPGYKIILHFYTLTLCPTTLLNSLFLVSFFIDNLGFSISIIVSSISKSSLFCLV